MSKEEKYGFVYIWYDNAKSKKHIDQYLKRFYIGCHWGTEDDGYICSSNWMRDAYRRRPEDFKRRIISRIYTSRADLSEEEYKWLSLIPKEELGKKYYNLCKYRAGHCKAHFEEAKEKMSQSHLGKKIHSEEHKEKISKANKGENNYFYDKHYIGELHHFYGKHHSEETKEKISKALKGKCCGKNHHHFEKHPSEETKEKLRQAHKGEKHNWYRKEFSEEHKKNISRGKTGHHHSEEAKEKMRQAKLGKSSPNKGKKYKKNV